MTANGDTRRGLGILQRVEAGSDQEVKITLQPAFSLSGRVVAERGPTGHGAELILAT